MTFDRISRRDVDLDYPGARSELPSGDEPEFGLRGQVLMVRFEDGRVYSWTTTVGWCPE